EEILRAYNKVPPLVPTVTQVLVTVFNESFRTQSQKICNVLRENGINAEVTLPEEKIDKQLKYANKKKIPFVLLVGPDEVVSQKVTIKEMKTGNQQTKSIQESIQLIRSYVRT
ncbi:MAG TPA: His/Gly/Thr/Pro-type tRNA ligase C-terminal domain-containing protein, partial [Patescibacteria group bacterium]|nr:His/Gly/Thr/Pro-type tRNA ligase C-terminal domain-containing protein [Patescibacteria group bacterium]